MSQDGQLPRVLAICGYVAAISGAILIVAGIYAILYGLPIGNSVVKYKDLAEVNVPTGAVLLLCGVVLVALVWIPRIVHRPLPELKQEVRGEEYVVTPKSTAATSGKEVAIPEARTIFRYPSTPNWKIVSNQEFAAEDDVSIWDLPLFSAGRNVMIGSLVPALSEHHILHANSIPLTLAQDTNIDNLSYSGALPDNPELRKRILRAGVETVLLGARAAISQDATSVDLVRGQFGVEGPVPVKGDGSLDVDAALEQIRTKMLGEDGPVPSEFMKAYLKSFERTDLPVTKDLRNSVSFRIFRGSAMVESDQLLKLQLGSGLTLWQFIVNLPRVIGGINLSTVSNITWSPDNKFATFTMETNLSNAMLGGVRTSANIVKLSPVFQLPPAPQKLCCRLDK
jgi:hypothetical protein